MAGQNVSPFEIIAGPATVYVAPVGEAFPAVNAVPAGNWLSLGDTDGGVTVEPQQAVNMLRTDQAIGPVKAIRTEVDLHVTFNLAELTLETMAKVLNNVTVTTGGSPSRRILPIGRGTSVVQQLAMLIRGPSPYGDFDCQWEIPRIVQSGAPSMMYGREDKSVLTTEWNAIVDPNAASVNEIFGRLVAQDA